MKPAKNSRGRGQPLASAFIEATQNNQQSGSASKGNVARFPSRPSGSADFKLKPETLLKIHDVMVRSRIVEERLIKMFKQSHGYFWIGGPGEEAFNVPLGLQIDKGQGPAHDYLHLHYRAGAIMMALGAEPKDSLRQMKNTANDPYSGGRNFSNHFSVKEWNVVPVFSTIETQYAMAIGTAIAQKRHGGSGVTIVNGGDAGTAEGDFESALTWATRPGNELPMLIIVMNNGWGISTAGHTQHSEKKLSDRGIPYGMKTQTINGNNVEESWFAISEALKYVREERKPFLLEARVSRLFGHSSATGANRELHEVDPISIFEDQLEQSGVLDRKSIDELWNRYNEEVLTMAQEVIQEPLPEGSTIYDHIYLGQIGKPKEWPR